MKKFLQLVGFALLATIFGGLGALLIRSSEEKPAQVGALSQAPGQVVSYGSTPSDYPANFREASSKSTESVVFIKTISELEYNSRSWMEWFYGDGSYQRSGSGSGVIYSRNGYIITNNHVIDDADNIEVIHDGVAYSAELIGTDPNTDIALVKVDAEDLPAIAVGSSADLQVGDWVLAVGNPFNLTSTVTAGIVSAKSRSLGILRTAFPIESFIQTDAAINPGNSGGALVDIDGNLVGINTAILSRTGSYAGYGFAVPVDLVKKVVEDIIRYGEVQKPFFGAEVANLDPDLVEEMGNTVKKGVVITGLQGEGAADMAGLQEGDVLTHLEAQEIASKAEFEEMISLYSPGEKATVRAISKEGEAKEVTVTLQNRDGGTGVLVTERFSSNTLGAEFERVSKVERDLYDIEDGVKITEVHGGYLKRLGISEGFIVTSINDVPTSDPEETIRILERIRGRVVISGISPEGKKGYYSFYL